MYLRLTIAKCANPLGYPPVLDLLKHLTPYELSIHWRKNAITILILITDYFEWILALFVIVMLDGSAYNAGSPSPLNKVEIKSLIVVYALKFPSHSWYLILIFIFSEVGARKKILLVRILTLKVYLYCYLKKILS